MRYLGILLAMVLVAGCQKPETPFICEGDLVLNTNENFGSVTSTLSANVFVINEGGFTNGNASIDLYNPNTSTVTNGIFEAVNGFPLGDVLQSITFDWYEAYIIVNNSQKIEVISTSTGERRRTISNFDSPRFMSIIPQGVAVSAPSAIITDFLANQVQLVNLYSGCVLKTLDRSGWTEQIFRIGESYWILERSITGASNEFARMIEVDKELNLLTEVDLPIEPNSIAVDNNNNIWILSSGKESENLLPSLIRLNTSSKQIELQLEFTDWSNIPLNLVIDSDGEQLYYNRAEEIYTLNIMDTALPTTSLFSTSAQNIYALSIPLDDNNIYVSDAMDFIQNGSVYIYTSQGIFVNSFSAGVIPSKVVSGSQ